MSEETAAIVWFLGIVGWLIIRLPYRRRAQRTKTVTDNSSKSERVSLGLTIVGLVLLPLLQLTTGLFDFASIPFSPLAAWFGMLVMILFLIIFYLSHKHLARNWSVTLEIRKDHELVQSGIYKLTRHPMYTSFWLWGIAQFLLVPNWIAGLSGLVSVAWLYFSRIDHEEAMMRSQFGEAYDAYCERTYRLLPKLFS